MEQRHIVVMGVSGGGKTTLATALADRLGYVFAEGDDFHSEANREKMRAGTPLNDDDRAPWLVTIRDWMTEQARAGTSTVVTCSALRRAYRDVLREAVGQTVFVHVAPPVEETATRIGQRRDHYMPASLLESQIQTLEELGEDEPGFAVRSAGSPDEVLTEVLNRLESS